MFKKLTILVIIIMLHCAIDYFLIWDMVIIFWLLFLLIPLLFLKITKLYTDKRFIKYITLSLLIYSTQIVSSHFYPIQKIQYNLGNMLGPLQILTANPLAQRSLEKLYNSLPLKAQKKIMIQEELTRVNILKNLAYKHPKTQYLYSFKFWFQQSNKISPYSIWGLIHAMNTLPILRIEEIQGIDSSLIKLSKKQIHFHKEIQSNINLLFTRNDILQSYLKYSNHNIFKKNFAHTDYVNISQKTKTKITRSNLGQIEKIIKEKKVSETKANLLRYYYFYVHEEQTFKHFTLSQIKKNEALRYKTKTLISNARGVLSNKHISDYLYILKVSE